MRGPARLESAQEDLLATGGDLHSPVSIHQTNANKDETRTEFGGGLPFAPKLAVPHGADSNPPQEEQGQPLGKTSQGVHPGGVDSFPITPVRTPPECSRPVISEELDSPSTTEEYQVVEEEVAATTSLELRSPAALSPEARILWPSEQNQGCSRGDSAVARFQPEHTKLFRVRATVPHSTTPRKHVYP